jgi:Uma2 family endonuclease
LAQQILQIPDHRKIEVAKLLRATSVSTPIQHLQAGFRDSMGPRFPLSLRKATNGGTRSASTFTILAGGFFLRIFKKLPSKDELMIARDFKKRVFSQGIVYPDSDGKPMADHTLQALWIVLLYDNLRKLFDGQDVFVAADLFWYPVEGDPKTRVAPDVLVVFGRPDGYRGSYKQWMEENIPPQIVFEILSPSNTGSEMLNKLHFYEQYGVEEFIVLDPEKSDFVSYLRKEGKLLRSSETGKSWESPKLGISFSIEEGELVTRHSDGSRFKTFSELDAEKEELKMEKNAALSEIETLKARLRELGEDV